MSSSSPNASEGARSYQGRGIAYDAQADLALIAFTGAVLPPAALDSARGRAASRECHGDRRVDARRGRARDRRGGAARIAQTVSVLSFDPATRTYANTRYLMSSAGMAAARAARGNAAKVCTADQATLSRLAGQQAAVRATLPPVAEREARLCLQGRRRARHRSRASNRRLRSRP